MDGSKVSVKTEMTSNIFSSKSSETNSFIGKSDDSETNQDMPSKICPSVDILNSNPAHDDTEKCDSACSTSTDFHKIYREFKKRKTRRKESAFMDMTSLYPLSRLVENLDSDSDGNSSPKSSFSSSIVTPSNAGYNPIHSQYCKLPGVTGCRGNNGSWFDWSQMFCVNHHKGSETLPEEKEILPLQVLPYVELDWLILCVSKAWGLGYLWRRGFLVSIALPKFLTQTFILPIPYQCWALSYCSANFLYPLLAMIRGLWV